ncbi:glycoside hydrolase family 15 protein [Myxosarcina sp. GI1(2024)]
MERESSDDGALFHSSVSLLLAHEDKTYSGATIASMSFPWGEQKGDGDRGGYHLVWTRDLVNSVAGLLASGHRETAVRSLMYLVTCQQEDGSFAQNFWLDGEPYWHGMQLDEIGFPILLAQKLAQFDALPDFDLYPMIIQAAGYLVRQGPATQQERWEVDSGYSPSTLACNIAALICAASFARQREDETAAEYIEEYADFLRDHIEAWTVTTEGTLVPGIERHFIRITPAEVNVPHPNEDPNNSKICISARPPGTESQFSEDKSQQFLAREIVDAGFLLLVRYGIIAPDDPLIIDSLKVVDAILKVETPFGPCWRRYNHDWYGQKEDGSAYEGVGVGRTWPLLTGERAHYELAAGNDITPYIQAMEGFATETGLLTEQIWDSEDIPDAHMYLGRPTGAAMPLMWAHAEYIKLLRSRKDGRVFDFVPEVGDRYLNNYNSKPMEVWKFHRQVTTIDKGTILRIQADKSFKLHWTNDEWQAIQDLESTRIAALGLNYVDLTADKLSPIEFTFFWTGSNNWEQRNYRVKVV